MAQLDPRALYHRTLDDSLAKLPYIDYEARRSVFEEAARKTNTTVGTAYTIRDRKLVPIVYKFRKDQDFKTYATPWEILHSKLPFGAGSGNVDPVVDNNMTVIGHVGWFESDSIFLPVHALQGTRKAWVETRPAPSNRIAALNSAATVPAAGPRWQPRMLVETRRGLDDVVADGGQVFADDYSRLYLKQGCEAYDEPQTWCRVITDPEGRVACVLARKNYEGLETSWVTPLDLIALGRLVVVGVRVLGSLVIRSIARRAAARLVPAVIEELEAAEIGVLVRGRAMTEFEEIEAGKLETVMGARRSVTRADMLKWESDGGHTLQNHNPMLSRGQLKSRIIGKESTPAPQPGKGSIQPRDYRLWRGEREVAASKFASEDIMHKAISDVIHQNLREIEAAAANGKKIVLARRSVGYVTGEGWVTTAGKLAQRNVKAAESAMFYSEKLTGISVYIEPLKNGKWFVRTAFPELIE
jgi:hypothetical protein